jgi:hypothetical protein
MPLILPPQRLTGIFSMTGLPQGVRRVSEEQGGLAHAAGVHHVGPLLTSRYVGR